MSEFDRDPRRQQELRMRPYIDSVYRSVFGSGIKIDRFDSEDKHILDKEFAMDVKITMPNGMVMLGQEKALSNKYKKYKTLTVEYHQNQYTSEPGDWFKLSVQFYFCGYENDTSDGFDTWIIADWPRVVVETNNQNVRWYTNGNHNGSARADFTYTYYQKLPENCVIACSWGDGTNEHQTTQTELW
jgi:hypothetical protein